MGTLHQVAQLGQSIWYDNLRRSMLTSGSLAHLIEHDGLRGMTSNPSIFDKAIGSGTDYDAAIAALDPKLDDISAFEQRRDRRHPGRVRRVPHALRRHRRPRRLCVARGIAAARPRHGGHDRRGEAAARRGRAPQRDDQDPRHPRGRAGDRGVRRRRHPRQHDAAVRRRRLPRRGERVHRRPRDLREQGRRCQQGRGRRELLPVAHRHGGRRAARPRRRPRAPRQGGGREREGRVRRVRGRDRVAALAVAREGRRAAATPAVGEHVGEEPGVRQAPLRLAADRQGHRQHDARATRTRSCSRTAPARSTSTLDHGRSRRRAARRLAALGAAGVNLQHVTDKLLADGVAAFAKSFDQLLAAVADKRKKLSQGHGGKA